MPDAKPPLTPNDSPAAAANRDANLGACLMRSLDLGLDAAHMERAMLTFLTHREGLGFREAHLLVWSEARGRFEGWLWSDDSDPEPLERLLDPTRPPAHRPDVHERIALWRRCSFASEDLDPVVRESWTTGRALAGRADTSPTPWPAETALHVVPLRRGNEAHGLVVCTGGESKCGSALGEDLDRVAALTSTTLELQRRLLSERKHAARALAIAEISRACVSDMNVAEALHLAARLVVRVAGARGSAVWRVAGDGVRLDVTHGPAGQRDRIARELHEVARGAAFSMTAKVVGGPEALPDVDPAVAWRIRCAYIVPLAAYGRPLGALAVYDRAALHPSEEAAFTTNDVAFFNTVADLLAVVLDQAARFEAMRTVEREREDMRGRMRQEERLAALGELATRAAREVRNPIASIAAFARRAYREMAEGDPHREYLEIVMQEVERIDRIVNEHVAMADSGAPRLRVVSLNAIVQRALQRAGEPLIRRRIRLLKKLDPDLPALLLDPQRVGRVVANVVTHALDAVPVGGRIRVQSRAAGAHVALDISHDGSCDPGTIMEELFVPFAVGREGASGLGLGVARQIIREHGGEIRVRSDAEWSTVISLTFPIPENEDRRRTGPERRHSRADRRRSRVDPV